MTRILLSGNEAIARGAWEAGVSVGVGYPGTPSTEVLESLVRYDAVRCEWAPNEKVAAEVAGGVSLGGCRALVTMKHVGLNVAADPIYTQAYTGVSGGLVYLVADDPGMHSSQNEQDTRNHAAGAHVPVLEPANSQEALEFTRRAFELSEMYDIPVIVRMTTRVSHGKTLVETGERREATSPPYTRAPQKYVMMPANARVQRVNLASRLGALQEEAEQAAENRVEMHDSSLGIITSGVSYEYVREALPEASVLKLGLVAPLPVKLIQKFAAEVEKLVVIEELGDHIAMRVRAMGVPLVDVGLPEAGELSPALIAAAFGVKTPPCRTAIPDLPPRPPLLCAGCPHRGVFYALRKMGAAVTGDIGCYTLAALPPLGAMDSCVCMGASIGMAHGLALTGASTKPVVAVIGDSTFAHSGVTGLMHMAYAGQGGTVVILDNRTTAMTGHQGNPVNGLTIDGSPTYAIDLEALASVLGAASVSTINPHDLAETQHVLREEVSKDHLSVIIAKAPCALLTHEKRDPFAVNAERCRKCGACLNLGCPAISRIESGAAVIDSAQCVGCELCVQVCQFDAIEVSELSCGTGGA